MAWPLLLRPLMALVLQRYSWALNALAVALSAYLAARTVNTAAAAAIGPEPVVRQASTAPEAAGQPQLLELDAEKVAKLLDVPLPKAAPAGTQTQDQPHGLGGWDRPVRSSLHGTLIGTAIADPLRYSLCQITDPDLNETQVYGIGDKYQGAHIYAIEKERVLLDHDGVNEYIDSNGLSALNLGSPQPIRRMAPAQHDAGDGVRQVSENQYVVVRREINSALTNLPDLVTKPRRTNAARQIVSRGISWSRSSARVRHLRGGGPV